MQIVRFNNSTKDTLVASVEEFRELKKWIETTSLFQSIVYNSGTDTKIHAIDGSIDLSVANRKIKTVDELPIEILIEFYHNWPDKMLHEVTCDKPSPGSIIHINPEALKRLSEPEREKISSRPATLDEVRKINQFLDRKGLLDSIVGKVDLASDERREDMLVGALEGGSNYWYSINLANIKIIQKYLKEGEVPILSIAMWQAIKAGETIEIHDTENPNEKLGDINMDSIRKGEAKMLEEQPRHFENILSENDDAETSDVWFQYCVLGEIAYG